VSDDGAIAAYLDELRRGLPAGLRRRRILSEVGSHLEEGAEQERSAGLPPREAERVAVARFGPAEPLARRFAAELADDGARSATGAAAMALAGILLLWIAMSQVGAAAPWPGERSSIAVEVWATWLGFGVALMAIGLGATLGRFRLPRSAVAAAAVAVVAMGVSTVACARMALASEYASAPMHTVLTLVTLRAAVTIAALVAVARGARQVVAGLGASPRRA
jgi:HAAS domain-containing protein